MRSNLRKSDIPIESLLLQVNFPGNEKNTLTEDTEAVSIIKSTYQSSIEPMETTAYTPWFDDLFLKLQHTTPGVVQHKAKIAQNRIPHRMISPEKAAIFRWCVSLCKTKGFAALPVRRPAVPVPVLDKDATEHLNDILPNSRPKLDSLPYTDEFDRLRNLYHYNVNYPFLSKNDFWLCILKYSKRLHQARTNRAK